MTNQTADGHNRRLEVLHDTGKRLAAARTALGFSLADFAKVLGVEPDVYFKLEAGSALPSLEQAVELRAAFGLTLDYIFCGDAGDLRAPLRRELEA